MMKQVNLYEAKTQLSALVEEARAGEEIVIAKNGKPAAKLVPIAVAHPVKRRFGFWAKYGWKAPDDLFERLKTDDELQELFENGPIFLEPDK